MRFFGKKQNKPQTTSASDLARSNTAATPALPAHALFYLQRAAGNHAVQQMLQAQSQASEVVSTAPPGVIQTKLAINKPGDKYEKKADRIADQVTAKPAHSKPSNAPPEVQRFAGSPTAQPATAPASVDQTLASPGMPLEHSLRQDMEQRFGHDFSRVRVHTGSAAEKSAQALGALAYTAGSDIVFGAGRYEPHTPAGAGLLAHELTHVAQAGGRPSPLRLKPDPTKLNIVVPDPDAVEPFEPSVQYAWQDKLLLASIFPYREDNFRKFLKIEKEKDLGLELKRGFDPAILTDIGGKILDERKRLTDELNQYKQLRQQAEKDLLTAKAETKKHLTDAKVREQARQKRKLEEKSKRLAQKANQLQTRTAELEKKGEKIGAGEQRELENKREMLNKINEELEPATQSLRDVSEALETGLAPLSSAEAKLKSEIEEYKKQAGALQPQLERVKGGVDEKTKKANPEVVMKWQLHEFEEKIKSMHHDELLSLILDEFDADKNFTRYPKQVRYLVIHFSGMRYATAHKTWGDPRELLATLKELEIREMFEDPNRKTKVEKEAEETVTTIEGELKKDIKKIGVPRKNELLKVKQGLDITAAVRARLYKKNPQFEKLETMMNQRAEALEQNDDEKTAELSAQIEQLEKGIGATKLQGIRAELNKADFKRLETLRNFRLKEACQAMGKLNELQALSILQAMKDQFPDWVWPTVVRRTRLRVNFTESKEWEDPKNPKQITLLKQALTPPLVRKRWKDILANWPRESSSWNKEFADKYIIVAETVVCNQLTEHAQYLLGKATKQGIRPAVNWYRDQESEAKAKGITGANRPFFIRPTKKEDFVLGAALFWARFESDQSDKQPAKENMALPLSGIDFLTEGKHPMRDGLVEGEWTYHIDAATKFITRTRSLGGSWLGPILGVETQWFSWRHEATVIDRDDRAGRVITFETAGGASMHTWPLASLIDPMTWYPNHKPEASQHRDWNVFVGFAPEGKALPELDKSLEKILGDRNAF